MSGFFNAVSACLVVLLLMAVGYFMGVKGWMTAAEKNFLSRFIINIAVPANCIVGLLNNLDRAELAQAGVQLLSVLLGVGIPYCCLWGRRLCSACPGRDGGYLPPWLVCPMSCLSAYPYAPSSLGRSVCPM